MNRRGLAWLLAFPLMTAGSLLAHGLAYRLAESDPQARYELLDGSGHAYLAAVPFVLGICGAFVVAGLVAVAARALRDAVQARPPAWPLALLPLLGFALQEHLERLAAAGELPLGTAGETSFLIGLGLQLPFALVALAAARVLVRGAEVLGRALAHVQPPRPRSRPASVTRPDGILLPRLAPLALADSERGPPR